MANPYAPPSQSDETTPGRTSVLAIVALVLAILPSCATPAVGLVLGILAYRSISRTPHLRGRGLAIAAMAVGGAQIGLVLFFYLLYNIVVSSSEPGASSAARATIQQLSEAVELYRVHADRLPTTQEGLQVLLDPVGDSAPVLDRLPWDPWRNPYRYVRLTETQFEISSAGLDEVHDTADDIRLE